MEAEISQHQRKRPPNHPADFRPDCTPEEIPQSCSTQIPQEKEDEWHGINQKTGAEQRRTIESNCYPVTLL